MNDILRLTLVIVLLTITLAAHFLVMSTLFPSRVTKTQNIIHLTLGRSFGLGMVNFLFFGLIAFVMLSLADHAGQFVKGLLTIPALLILGLLSILLSIGLTATIQHLAERIFPDMVDWKRKLWSAVILCTACALPFVGWFLLLPYVSFVGIGATILSFFQKS